MQICFRYIHLQQLLAVAVIAAVCCTTAPVTAWAQARKDSTTDKYGFRNLFRHQFDASRPYAAQLNPRAVSFVQEYIRKQGKELNRMKGWGKPYFDLFDQILAQYGIPREMKYLSVIESHLSSGLVSWAGAVGPWQIMPYEARRFGLTVNANRDERTDYNKSTHVAARLMKELYGEFNDWLLVVAAYNGGPGRVRQSIKKARSRDFWDLQYFLPEETRNHVKKFIGTHYVMEGSGGWTTMTAAEVAEHKNNMPAVQKTLSAEEEAGTVVIEIGGRYNSVIVANGLVMNIAQFNKWNPGFDKQLAEGKRFKLRIPAEKSAQFEATKNQLLAASVRALLEGTLPQN
ncbi:MAG TPA: lytic transglycosylase domain-containing protein [Sediminibacterium sp.]|nr:lytic transglycosylase domain-containing protein [Sediminibacterium sp.]